MNLIWRATAILILYAIPCPLSAESTGDTSLPPLEEVLRRVVEQAEKEQGLEHAFDQTYNYTRTKITEYRNSNGEVKKRDERRDERRPAPPPVGASNDSDATSAEGETTADSEAKGRAYKRRDFSVNEELLNRFEFTLVGREMVNGRPALVITFQPANKKLPERSLKERFLNRTAGKVWVDETEFLLARGRFYLTEKVNVIGGLVGAVQGFTCDLDRQRTDDGLWFTRAMKWHLEGRQLFFHRTIDYREERTDVRKVQDLSYDRVDAARDND